VLSVKLQQLAVGLLKTFPSDTLSRLLLEKSELQLYSGRSILDLAVETQSALVLDCVEVEHTVDLVWKGSVRWTQFQGVVDDSNDWLDEPKRKRLTRRAWHTVCGFLLLPALAFLPAQKLHEEDMIHLFPPRIRYYTLHASFLVFSVLIMYLPPCTEGGGCGASSNLDNLIGACVHILHYS